MVKYFLENDDIYEFIKKIKAVIRSGIIGILISIILYVNKKLYICVDKNYNQKHSKNIKLSWYN